MTSKSRAKKNISAKERIEGESERERLYQQKKNAIGTCIKPSALMCTVGIENRVYDWQQAGRQKANFANIWWTRNYFQKGIFSLKCAII